jgi:hypothetical protein
VVQLFRSMLPTVKSMSNQPALWSFGTYGTGADTMEIITTGRKGKYLNTLEKYHIYEISTENLHMNDIHMIHTTPYLKHYTKFTQDNTTHIPSPTLSPSSLPPWYNINTGVRALHMHNIHTQGKTTTCSNGVNDIQTRGKVSI